MRRRSERTKCALLVAALVGPWVLYAITSPATSFWSVALDLSVAVAAGASVVVAAWTTSLDLVRWKRASLTYLLAVNLALAEFSYLHWSISESAPTAFSSTLGKIDAAYFAFTVFTTTGFGDIAATSGTARLIVLVQMVVGFAAVLVGLAVLLSNRPAIAE